MYDTTTKTFTYVDSNGVQQAVDISSIVKANETLTSLTLEGTELKYIDEKTSNTTIDLAPVITSVIATGGDTVTSNTLSNDGINTITSTVNGVARTVSAVNTVQNSLAGAALTTTVNGVSSTLDLTNAVVAAATTSLVTQDFTVTAGQTTFDLNDIPSSVLTFFINGQKIKNTAITIGATKTVNYVAAVNDTYVLKTDDVVTIQYIK